jgi:ATP-dependent Clp endopeptidase proteolytic subunit ClpP
MNYCIDPSAEEPIMLIDKHIGMDEEEGMGIDGSLFQQELLMLDSMGKKRIQIWINSPGGVVMDGYNIFGAILKTKTPVDTHCAGIAASIAAVIFQAGRKRVMADYSILMYHNPFGGDDQEQLSKMKESLVTMVSEKSGKTPDQVSVMMDKTTWLSASEAFADGLCDEIEATSQKNKKRKTQDAKALWKESSKILNSILHKNDKKMTKVTNKLGLNDDASEASIFEAISKIETESIQNKRSAETIKEEMDKLKSEMDKLKAEYEDCKNSLDVANKKAVEAEEAEKTEKAKNLITGYATQGRIKTEEVQNWVDTSKAIGLDKIKDMLEKLPLNKIANAIEIGGGGGTGTLGSVVASAMADLRTKNKI